MSAENLREENFCDFLNLIEWQIFMDENMPEQQQASDFLLTLSAKINPCASYSRKTWKRFRDIIKDDTRNLIEPVHADFKKALNDLCDSVLEKPQNLLPGIFSLRRTPKGEKALLMALVNALKNNKEATFVQRHLPDFNGICPDSRKLKAQELHEKANLVATDEEEIDPVEARHRRNIYCDL